MRKHAKDPAFAACLVQTPKHKRTFVPGSSSHAASTAFFAHWTNMGQQLLAITGKTTEKDLAISLQRHQRLEEALKLCRICAECQESYEEQNYARALDSLMRQAEESGKAAASDMANIVAEPPRKSDDFLAEDSDIEDDFQSGTDEHAASTIVAPIVM